MKRLTVSLRTPVCILLAFSFFLTKTIAQAPATHTGFKTLGTRSWIRLEWNAFDGATGYDIFWSTTNNKPVRPLATAEAGITRFYIKNVQADQRYFVWLDARKATDRTSLGSGEVITTKHWVLDPDEENHLDIPSSAVVPEGMKLFWHDEFNDELLNRNKWSTNYYSSIDYLYKINFTEMRSDRLPQPAYILNGKTINLLTNDSLPVQVYDTKNQKKISSIQTYDWVTNENLLDNSRGGYFEVRVKRSSTGKPRGLNTAFWFDSPGPDLKYYLQEGTEYEGVRGIRPRGQVFEIDVFEYLNAQFVLHGHVDTAGRFQRNLATHIAEGYQHRDNWVVHGMLWTPTSIKHYINGNLIKEYSDKNQLYAPNHFMNVLLGSYGGGGTVNMEVDYIRAYQWPLEADNQLPNGGAEYNKQITPWEGTAIAFPSAKRSGNNGFLLEPGQTLFQYLYVHHSTDYRLTFWSKGNGAIEVQTNDITPVSGVFENEYRQRVSASSSFTKNALRFTTGKEYGNNTKIIRVGFTNVGNKTVFLDDVVLVGKESGK